MPWMVAHQFHGLGLGPLSISWLAGFAILGGAILLSWATELAERDIPQALAILVLALVSVLPEYAVDLHFAWVAGKDPSYAPFAVANMTGANRLLIGIGWASTTITVPSMPHPHAGQTCSQPRRMRWLRTMAGHCYPTTARCLFQRRGY